VDRRDPEYHIILRIGSGSHSDFKFARNDRNGDPLEGHRSDPFLILYYQIGLDDNNLMIIIYSSSFCPIQFIFYSQCNALSFAFIALKSHTFSVNQVYQANRKNIVVPLKVKWIGRSDRIGSAIQIMQVDRNAESDPIFQKDLDLEYDPRKSDRSEACVPCSLIVGYYIAIHSD
jgi:hypothetical protein